MMSFPHLTIGQRLTELNLNYITWHLRPHNLISFLLSNSFYQKLSALLTSSASPRPEFPPPHQIYSKAKEIITKVACRAPGRSSVPSLWAVSFLRPREETPGMASPRMPGVQCCPQGVVQHGAHAHCPLWPWLIELESCLYVSCGHTFWAGTGQLPSVSLKQVEKYGLGANRWTKVSPLKCTQPCRPRSSAFSFGKSSLLTPSNAQCSVSFGLGF